MFFLCFPLFLSHLLHISSASPIPRTAEEILLWQQASNEQLHISSPAIVKLRNLLSQTASNRGEEDRVAFQNMMSQLTNRILTLMRLSDTFGEQRDYSEASAILRYVLDTSKTLLDKKSLHICNSKLGQTLFREALIGNVTWETLAWHYGNWSLDGELSASDRFYYDMAAANIENMKHKALVRPYVLRFHLPQHAQTPSLAHFGHAMFDGLWPFALAYSQNRFSRWYEGAAIYVLDIGLYLLPLLRTVFPNLTFISFTSASAVPSNAEPVDLTGIGMASFSSLSEPPSNSTGLSKFFDLLLSPFNFPRLSVIRDIVYQQLNLTSLPQCIVLVSRVMSPSKLSAFHARHSLDQSRESHDLKPFHDLGPFVHTAMYYLQSTAHERRGIQNEHLLFRQLIKIFNKKFGICVKHVELSTLSIRQQFELFATAKIVIAQHGAALAYAPFMPNDPSDPGIVLELLPLINPTFHLTCNAMGVKHQFLDRSTHSELYLSDDNNFLEIDAKALVRLVAEQLEGWKAPSLGKVYNLTTANDISSPSDPEISPSIATMESTCSLSSTENIPEWGYVHSTIDLNDQPFVWRDSLHDLKDSPWLNLTFKDWEKRMKRDVYSKSYKMPQKIMASPTNIFDFYDTFQYDVINLNPGEYPPTIPVNERNLQDYIQKYGPFPPNTLRYIHLKNRTLVTQHPTASPLIPLQRQVQGPEGFPDLGFKFLDRNDSERLRYTQPIIASGEGYYIRISGEKGSAFYDSYAKSLLPAAFNHLAFPDRFASRKNRIDRLSIFFSEKGAVTNLHYDESGRGSVLCQLTGSKRIQLWSSEVQEDIIKPYEPSHHQYRRSKLNGRSPQLESLLLSEKRDHSLILKPGWCAYFPVRWWHHIESLGDENISTRFTVP